MNSTTKSAKWVGALFITGTLSGIAGGALTIPMIQPLDNLSKIASTPIQSVLGSLLVLVMGLSLAFIPLILYPILKKQNQVLSLGYVVFRSGIEAMTYVVTWSSMMLLLFVSKEGYGLTDTGQVDWVVRLIVEAREINTLATGLSFGVASLLFYTVLYQSSLVPHWLSIWGLAAIGIHLTGIILVMFNVINPLSTVYDVISIPLFIQEMVLAVRLIVKGFDERCVRGDNKHRLEFQSM